MRSRPWTWFVVSLLCFVGAYYCWKWADTQQAEKSVTVPEATTPAIKTNPASVALSNAQAAFESKLNPAKAAAQSATNRLAYVLNNTGLTVSQLEQNDTAILLANALIDTSKPLNFSIPDHLKSHGDPGTYLVQSRGKPMKEFRDALDAAGGKIISYFPNNAYQVRLSAEGARQMSANPLTQSVMPFEPYYKLQSSLLGYAVEQKPMPLTARLNVLVADDAMEETKVELKKLNVAIMKESLSPFGRVLTVRPQVDGLSALAQLTGVVLIEKHYERAKANDLTRQAIGVSTDSVTTTNYLNLKGSNVMVLMSDSGVDATHPDLLGRVFGWAITDLDGHGTHVAGIIAGDGTQSLTVSTNVQGSIMPATNLQYRGIAPLAKIMSVSFDSYVEGSIHHDIGLIPGGAVSDAYFQENAALTNALIINNSWGYVDDFEYDLAAANWDWATRDALPGVTGSQPVLAVWAAGNNGSGDDDGGGGFSDTIQSPGTSKNGVTVGALEHPRNITNEVHVTEGGVTNKFTPWLGETDTDYEVAAFSARGNVGIGVEGDRGRFKPDVVAPGVMIVSTRSQQWDESFYLNHTNVIQNRFSSEIVDTNFPNYYPVYVPDNAVGVSIRIVPNGNSPIPFPKLPIYVSAVGFPDPNGAYDFSTVNNRVSIPSDGGAGYLQTVAGVGFTIAVADSTNIQVSYDIVTTIFVTNNTGDYFPVLSNLNSTVGPWYRYESGTSMAAPAVSGTLALMQEFFAGKNLLPSPALMKALLINGARPTGFYNVAVQNTINFQGWGLINLPNTLPPGITSLATGTGGSMYFLDQSPANALVTGSAQTYNMTLVSSNAAESPMRITLAWTDPPGNPSAAIKLVNDLNLVVTNLDDPLNPVIYYGNDITAVSSPYNVPEGTNAPVFDAVNNVENIFLPPNAGTNFTITVIGHRINVNAVTAHTNDVAQDYALVISCGNGEVTNAMTVTTAPAVYTITPNITVYTNFATLPLLNQHVGASSPMLGLNTVPLGTNTSWAAANGVITIGETNQWHFYVVTNTTSFTNAAFVTFIPPELSVSRIGVRESSIANATRGEADIELYVSTDANLLNLDPAAIQAADKSVTRGGTEFIAYQKPLAPIYYVGVKSEDQQAAEFAFYSVFSQDPFSQRDADGNLLVRGINVPTIIPDGSPAHPGVALVLALAIEPVQIRNIILTNLMTHEDFGDLVGTLSHIRKPVTLNNHTFGGVQTGTDPNQYLLMYDDSEEASTPGTQHTDGPGRLLDYVGDQGMGLWLMSQVDNALSHTGAVNALTIKIVPHIDTNVVDLTVQPNSFAYDSIDVPVEATNLSITLTFRLGSVGPVELYARRGDFPTRTAYDKSLLGIVPPGGTLTIDTSDFPPINPGRYYIGVFNPTLTAQDVRLIYSIGLDIGGTTPVVFVSTNTVPILDDAVTYSTTYIDTDKRIARVDVGVAITHPRVSDLALTLISPKGTRVLLSENRGGLSVDGMGGISYTTNAAPPASSGDFNASTNIFSVPLQPGILWIDYNFFSEPDSLHVYYGDLNNQIFDSGLISGTNRFTINLDGSADKVILVMNEGGNTNSATTVWTYTATAVTANQNVFTFTENTNRAQLPIKFAPTPFVSQAGGSGGTNFSISTLEAVSSGDYTNGQVVDGWTVVSNQVSVVADPAVAFEGNQFLALGAGNISQTLPTVTGRKYTLTYRYRGPSAVSLWRGENNGLDSIGNNNALLTNGLGFTVGKVGQAFNYNGPNTYAVVPASSSLDVGAGSGITLDSWINVTPAFPFQVPIFEWSQPTGGDPAQGVHFWVQAGASSLSLYASMRESNSINAHQVFSPLGLITNGSFYHVALAYDNATGIARFYINGAMVTQTNIGILRLLTTYDLYLGRRVTGVGAGSYSGLIDEAGIYNRALSTAELDGIFKKGSLGKFDSGASFPENLAEAKVTLNGASTVVTGDNNNWQTATVDFTASQDGMPLTFEGLQPGILLDDVSLYEFPQSSSLYYIPEESLDTIKGESALGDWYLEMWDSRVGATNPVPVLEGWSLQFVFDRLTPAPTLPFIADTNINEGSLLTVTNTGSSLDTNQFLTYSISSDVSGTNQPSIDANGIITWTPNEVQGPGTYTITTVVFDSQSPKQKAMNTFVVIVNELNRAPEFNLLQTNYTVSVNSTLTVTNTATDADIPANVLTYELFGPANSSIDTNTGVIRFTPDAGQLLTTNMFKTVVTDTNQYALSTNSLSATNYFFVFVTPPELTNGVSFTNSIPPGGFFYYAVHVPTNADFATNILLFATGPLNMFFNQTGLPTGTNAGDFGFLTNSLGGIGSPILGLSTTPPLIPGSTYFLGLQNTNSFTVTNAVKVDFHLVLPTPIFYISDITYTNIGGTNGFLLTWFAPTNQLFQVQWTPDLSPATWTTFTNPPVVAYDTLISPTNSLFKFFDNGSETGGFGPTRYYRLILVVTPGNTSPALPVQVARTLNPLETLVVTNTATDADVPVQTLNYTLLNPPAGATIDTNGIITWTTTAGQAGTSNSITTVVTDSGVPNLSTTNTFAVIVNPLPTLSVTYTNIGGTNGNLLTWYAPTNDLFTVEFTDSLFPVNWQSFSNIIAYTGPVTPTNGLFSFFDDGSQYPFTGPRFYRLILLGVVGAANTSPVLPVQLTRTLNPLETLVVTNTATDADTPVQTLSYTLLNPPAGATITSNGVISWTPTTGQAGTSNSITTVVTDSGIPNLSATNAFAVIVNPLPTLSVTYTNVSGTNGNLLTWYAPTNDLFKVEFTDSLFPVNWQSFSNIIAYTGPVTPTNGLFSFFDDGSEHPFVGPRFYRLILQGVATPVNTPPSLNVISFGPGGLTLQWMATTNYQFQVEWTTNLIPIIVWTPFPDIITSTNGNFSFTDTNVLMSLKYYHLLLLP